MKKVLSIFLSLFMLWACSDKEDPSQPIQPILPDDDDPVEVEDSVFYQLKVDGYELVAYSQSGTCMLMQADTTFAFSCLFDSCGARQLVAYCDSTGMVERIVADNQVVNILYHEDKQKMDIFYKKKDNTIGWIENVESPYSKLSSRVEAGDVPYSAISVMNNLSYAVYTVINTYDVYLPIKAWGLVQKYSKAPIPIGDAVQMIQHLLGKDYKQLMLKHYMTINQVMTDYSAWVKEELYGDAIPLLRNYAVRKGINDLTLTAYVEGVDSLKSKFKVGVIVTDDEHVTLTTYTYLDNKSSQYNPEQINYLCTFPRLETGKRYKFRPYLAPVSSSKYLKGAKCMLDYYKYGSIQDRLLLETKAEVLSNTDEEVKFKLSVAYAKTSVKMGMIYGEHPDLLNHGYQQVEYQPTFNESLMSYDYEKEVKLENMESGCIYYMPYIIYDDYVINRTLFTPTTTSIVTAITKEDLTFYGKRDSVHVINNPITGDAEAEGNTLTLNGSFDKNIINMVEESGMGVQKKTSSSRAGGQEDITIENSTVIKADIQEDGTFKATLDLNEEDSCVYYRAYIKVKGKVYYGEVKKYTKENEEDPLREALIELYNSTGGDNWKSNNNWCSDESIEDWWGINYDSITNSCLILLTDNNLTGEIHQTFPENINVKLRLGDNQLTSINISGSTGISELLCYNNQLTSLDVSNCSALTELDCGDNQLMSLNASNCVALPSLACGEGQLVSLDVSNCTGLTSLLCSDNQLTTLDISNCTALENLKCSHNKLITLDISSCTSLSTLYCEDNQLTSLDVSGCSTLTTLNCAADNYLTSLNASNCIALTNLFCGFENQLTSLNISNCTALTSLNTFRSQLISLDASNCTALKSIYIVNNQLASLDVSNCSALNSLYCDGNKLTSLDVSDCVNLKFLECRDNQLTSLDVSNCTILTELSCWNNLLTKLNVTKCTDLIELLCSNNQLTTLDISKCTLLTRLDCSTNQLTSLDITKCAVLTVLSCENNQLPSLDVSNCTTLKGLSCNNNKLSSLDISNCMDLNYLNCDENQLTSLDVSKCTKVTDIHCKKNQLISLNLSGCLELEWLDCSVNQLKSLDIPQNRNMYGLICNSNKINQEIPDWFSQFNQFIYDKKYHYLGEEVVNGETIIRYDTHTYGWWYPGEPDKGYHGK
ncbi:MAG: hypothetical protein J6J26_07865 [Bacteroides sp.]|nr:hypothetical protein [Bacteroides sp.]